MAKSYTSADVAVHQGLAALFTAQSLSVTHYNNAQGVSDSEYLVMGESAVDAEETWTTWGEAVIMTLHFWSRASSDANLKNLKDEVQQMLLDPANVPDLSSYGWICYKIMKGDVDITIETQGEQGQPNYRHGVTEYVFFCVES